VQIDRRKNEIRDEQGVRAKFGVAPEFIADYLALVGDAADGYPGIPGLGAKTAATLINRHGHIEQFPAGVLKGENVAPALLFKQLATLRTDAPLFKNVDELLWQGPQQSFAEMTRKMGDERLLARVRKLWSTRP
jgi:5'-3' exonuclease